MRFMPRSLRFRVPLLVFVVFLLAATAFMRGLHLIVVESNSRIEREIVERDVQRVRAVIARSQTRLQANAEHWVSSDMLASVAAGSANSSVASRTIFDELADDDLDFAVFVPDGPGSARGLVVNRTTNTASLASRAVTSVAATLAAGVGKAKQGASATGLVSMTPGPAIVTVHAVTTLVGGRPVSGLLVLGAYMEREPLLAVFESNQLQVTLHPPLQRAGLPASAMPAAQEGLGRVYVGEVDGSTIAGWSTLQGLDGRPALLYVVTEPRTGMAGAMRTLQYMGWGLFVFVGLFGLGMALILEGSILRRLSRLHVEVGTIGSGPGPHPDVSVEGSDEIADLAAALNATLKRLGRTENALKHAADHDYLTGLANRRRFEEDAVKALSEMHRTGASVAVLLFDVDDFKVVNDTRGHKTGDDVLIWLARLMKRAVRAYSTVSRVGGDEFAILLPHTSRMEAGIIAERLQLLIAHTPCASCEGVPVNVRVCVGMAVAPDDGTTLEQLNQHADDSLYAQKSERRAS